MKRRDVKIAAAILAASLAYAVIRYNVFGDVPVRQIPLYVVNKAAALASLVLLGLSLVAGDRDARKRYGRAGLFLLGGHAVISAVILRPAYFAKYYREDGTFYANIEAGLAFGVAGVLCAAYLFMAAPKENNGKSLRRGVGRLALAATAIHTALLGYPVWTDFQSWPGYLPPITLLATGIAIGMLAYRSMNARS